jgi:NADPH:quinone reductase-like Zn-dependent oxidoreductase
MGLLEAGKLTPAVDKTYPLEQAADAIRYLEAGAFEGRS